MEEVLVGIRVGAGRDWRKLEKGMEDGLEKRMEEGLERTEV